MNFRERARHAFGSAAESAMSPEKYYMFVRELNLYLQSEISQLLSENENRLGNITLVTPGSDGRLEKGSYVSHYEIIAFTPEEVDTFDYKSALVRSLKAIFPVEWSDYVELKGSSANMVVSRDRYQPRRIADASLLYGSTDKLIDAQLTLGQQVHDLSRSEMSKISSLKRDAKRATSKGSNVFRGNEIVHIDVENGVVHYNPSVFQLSFKIGPLRLVQNGLLLEEVKYIKRTGKTDFYSTLLSNIGYRLEQLSSEGISSLTREEMQEIFQHYAFFLKLYHKSERAYGFEGKTEVQLDESTLYDVLKRQEELLILMSRFQLK